MSTRINRVFEEAAVRISMKTDYALRAVVYLAARGRSGPVQTAEIARQAGIPESYLEQLLTALRKAGLVSSSRGPQGGHTLATRPSKITAWDVVRVIEGPVVVMDCGAGAEGCHHTEACGLQGVWDSVRSAVQEVLQRTTVEDLVERQVATSAGAMYHI